jgi:hypothetical protein
MSLDRSRLLALASAFFDEVLVHAPWFAPLNGPAPRWDVLFIGGSAKYGIAEMGSDLDLFLVMPKSTQREHQVDAVYHYRYGDQPIEVSQLSTELMTASAEDKKYLFHWHAGILVKATSPEAEASFRAAGALSALQLKQIVWTAFAEFVILDESFRKNPRFYDDPLTTWLNVAGAIESFAGAHLLVDERSHTPKWLSRELLRTHPRIHAKLAKMAVDGELSEVFFLTMRRLWQGLLSKVGLFAATDGSWSAAELDLILFQ